jgi:tetratricopeptide (TPR) repeat protein
VKVDNAERKAVKVQLAEANLRVGHYRQARDLFAESLGLNEGQNLTDLLELESAGVSTDGPASLDPRVVLGYAESLFHMGRYEEVLPVFNHLATKLPADSDLYWRSLLRDLQCRTALGHPPEGVIKVIEQQRFLHRDLGGPEFEPQFVKLLRENKDRLAGG